MEINDKNVSELRNLLSSLLSPDNATRKSAEGYLNNLEKSAGFSVLLLHLISLQCASNDPQEMVVRQSGAVLFKNAVKKRWDYNDEEPGSVISDNEKGVIKTHIVELMCSAPLEVQKQLAEAVTLISKHDFPEKWENLLPNLVTKLVSNAEDPKIAKGVMLTANSIMKRFRYAFSSDDLFRQILFCLEGFQAPLTEKYRTNHTLIEKWSGSKNELVDLFETQRLMTRIFFSLNWQDLPEYFEDNISVWMAEFAKYLNYTNPILVDDSEDNEAGPIEKLQSAILENLNLFATKYESEFEPFLPQFTQHVWKLLMEVTEKPKHDILATNSIKFLTSVSSKHMNVSLFTEPVLRDIVQHIVVRNLTATEADEELFEDNPIDYIRKDMEGSDTDTRRRSAMDLVRSLLKFFAPQLSQLCVSYIDAMLTTYAQSREWRAKDAALHLVLAVSILTSSTASGAGDLNPNVDIMSLFNTQIVPEVQGNDVNATPIVKADSLKMVCVFRSHLPPQFIISLLPHIIRHLSSSYVVVQTYAAICIEKFLLVKDKDPNTNISTPRLSQDALQPFFESLFTALFAGLDNPELYENDYFVKCIMRALIAAGSGVIPISELVIQHLTKAIERVCKNPVNPEYNHYLYECLAVLVKNTATANLAQDALTQHFARFESLLFPPFQYILANAIEEFVPYTFQILAQLLACRPTKGLTAAYGALFPPLLSPNLWESKGNVPALTELFRAYIIQGGTEIAAGGHLEGVLGVFQKLLSAKSTEVNAFELINACFLFLPPDTIKPYISTIFNLFLMRLQDAVKNDQKTTRYTVQFLHCLTVFASAFSGQFLYETMESITTGLVAMIVNNIWQHNHETTAACKSLEIKHMIYGGTRLLFESPVAQNPQIFMSLLSSLVALAKRKDGANVTSFDVDVEEEPREFDTSTYSKLIHAYVPSADPVDTAVSNVGQYLVTQLGSFCAARPGQYADAIYNGLNATQQSELKMLLTEYNVTLA